LAIPEATRRNVKFSQKLIQERLLNPKVKQNSAKTAV